MALSLFYILDQCFILQNKVLLKCIYMYIYTYIYIYCIYISLFCFYGFLWAFYYFTWTGQRASCEGGRQRVGEDMQHRAAGRNRTPGLASMGRQLDKELYAVPKLRYL